MKKILYFIMIICLSASCNDFIDVIPKGNTIPETVDDLGKMMNLGTFSEEYSLSEISYDISIAGLYCDDYNVTQDPAQSYYMLNYVPAVVTMVTWGDPAETSDMFWNGLYKSNYIANYVLENIDEVKDGVAYDRSEVKGRALVHRAMNYFLLVNLYSKSYNHSTASSDPGVPLVLEPSLSAQLPRASVEEVYKQIVEDLNLAVTLLKTELPETHNIPGLAAAYALRSRVCLWMQNYDQAYADASKAIESGASLIDYNTCSQVLPPYGPMAGINGYPKPAAINPEYIYARNNTEVLPALYTDRMMAIVDTENDLRYTLFSYYVNGVLQMFYNHLSNSGISSGEIWITKAEAALRKSNPDVAEAVSTLDELRINRIKSDAYQPTSISDNDLLLKEILNERRREVRLCELSFFNVKRLNQDPSTARAMKRTCLGGEYT
ncbi:MAG: RagB/SusD family nutrient uptake outer membrane protein, partial [Clostridiales bacterium]|nr:RagB/SusD family nutrient uptake outer membrane protein [Clostridiales bacterium]